MLLFMPIIVLFFHENGLSQKDVMVLQALFSVAVVVFEIPSGYFSDIIGRKITIIIGTFFGLIGFCVYALSYGFWGFLVAELLLGLGSSFISGTDSALIYDSLIDIGKEQHYVKFESRKTMLGNFSEATASILGGFLATISLRTPFYVILVFYFLAFLLSFTLVEPHRHKMDTSKGQMHNILKIVKFSLFEQKKIRWLIIYSAVVGSSTLTMVWFIQPYLEEVKLPLQYFGIAWAALNYSVGVFTYFSHHIEQTLGRRITLISLVFLTGIGYFLLSSFFTLWAALFIFIFYYIRGINSPLLKNYINQLISSDMRATVLSVQGLAGRLTFSIIGPFIGWTKDYYSMATAFALSGIIFVTLGLLAIVFLEKNRAL
jgi:MFS family permease